MQEIELYDSEVDKVYKFPVSQENYDAIIAGGNYPKLFCAYLAFIKKNFVH